MSGNKKNHKKIAAPRVDFKNTPKPPKVNIVDHKALVEISSSIESLMEKFYEDLTELNLLRTKLIIMAGFPEDGEKFSEYFVGGEEELSVRSVSEEFLTRYSPVEDEEKRERDPDEEK